MKVLQFVAFVEDGIELPVLDGGLLVLAVGEEAAREELDDDERIAEAVGIERNDIFGRNDLHAETVVVEVDADAEHTVGDVLGAAVQLLLLQPAHVVHIDQLFGLRFVQGDLLQHALVGGAA